jgi:uncharacterized membrane protein
MIATVTAVLLWFSAIGTGLLGGVYFAFSTFVMAALGQTDRAAGISAMNAINTTILKSLFMPFFFGTSATSLALAGLSLFGLGEPGALAMLAGGLIYIVGMLGVTMVLNVPLNNALAAVDPTSAGAAPVWARYLRDWTFWNHVRTVASVAASALFVFAIAAG